MVSVADVVSEVALGLVAHHVPDPGVSIRWVATSELEDPTPFLEGGELLLTTGLGAEQWAAEWTQYVGRLRQAGVSALGLGTGLSLAEVPSDLLRACVAHGLCLLEVPRTVPFVAVSHAAARLLNKAEREADRLLMAHQRSLVTAASRSGVDGLLASLASAVDGAVVTVDERGIPTSKVFGAEHLLDLGSVAREVGRLRQRGGPSSSLVIEGGHLLEVQQVGLEARAERFVAVAARGQVTPVLRATVTTAITLLGLAVDSARQQRVTERSIRDRAVQLCLKGDPESASVVLAVVSGQPSIPERVHAIRSTGPNESLLDGLRTLERAQVLATAADDELAAFLAPGGLEALVEALAEHGLRTGVGPLVARAEVGRSFDCAGHALAETSPGSPTLRWDDLVGRGAVAALDRDRASAFASSFLEPLDPMLLETLQVFLRHHGSRGRVADELGVHRNTVRARVNQLESLLHVSLDDPQARVNAWIALQVRQL